MNRTAMPFATSASEAGPRLVVTDPFGPETEQLRSKVLQKASDANPHASFAVAFDAKAMAAQAFDLKAVSDHAFIPVGPSVSESELLEWKRHNRGSFRALGFLTMAAGGCGLVGFAWLLLWLGAESSASNSGWIIAGLIAVPFLISPLASHVRNLNEQVIWPMEWVLRMATQVVTLSKGEISIVGNEGTRRIDPSMCYAAVLTRMPSGHLSIRLRFRDGRTKTIDWLPFDQGVEACLTEFASSCRPILDEGTSQWLGRLAA